MPHPESSEAASSATARPPAAGSTIGLWLQYLFFLRFPLLAGLFLASLPPLALWAARSLLGNLFVLQPWGIVLVSWFATSASWVVMITVRLIVRCAPERFRVPLLRVPGWLSRYAVPLSALLAVPMLVTLIAGSPGSWTVALGAVVGGVALALAGLVLTAAGQKMAASPDAPAPDLVLPTDWGPFRRIPSMGRPPTKSDAADHPETGRGPTVGYRHHQTSKLVPGHLLATTFFLITLAVYVAGYFAFRPGVVLIPSLGHLMLILLLVGWGLPGVSFALDRYRVPVLLLLIAASFFANTLARSDHFYEVLPEGEVEEVALEQVFDAADRSQGGDAPVVLVATSGGGITASLWTATVLTGLQQEVGAEVTRSIRLLSSVSGGSVGALFFLDRFGPDGAPPQTALEEIRQTAGASSLEGVSWGLAYPDLWRIFAPFLVRNRFLDRGWALEAIWRSRMAEPNATLSDWRKKMQAGELPAAVFNSTVVETGNQLLLTPLAGSFARGATDFLSTYPGYDLPVATGARLSATFPWISPVARPLSENGGDGVSPFFHGADGGYYDNYGIVTVVDWILSLDAPHVGELQRRGVVLVRIRAFPPAAEQEARSQPNGRGWIYSAVGPLITLLNVRTATQSHRDDVDVELLTRLAAKQGICATVATFTLEATSPLSWKLTDPERATIEGGWDEETNREALSRVRRAFAGQAPCERPEILPPPEEPPLAEAPNGA